MRNFDTKLSIILYKYYISISTPSKPTCRVKSVLNSKKKNSLTLSENIYFGVNFCPNMAKISKIFNLQIF